MVNLHISTINNLTVLIRTLGYNNPWKAVLRFVFLTFCFCFCIPIFSQRQQGIYVEAFGASTSVGVHYDSRFSTQTKWGGRIGMAYANSSSIDFFDFGPEKTTGWSIPIAVNYLLGGRKHNLELGVGFSYGIYHCMTYIDGKHIKSTRYGTFGFVDIGYRYQEVRGLMFRAGINPGMAIGRSDRSGVSKHGVQRAAVIYPYISVGYNF